MSRPPTARTEVLAAFTEHGICTNEQLIALWNSPRGTVQERVHRLMNAGLVVRINPGHNPANYKLTAAGVVAAAAGEISSQKTAESTVAAALASQPNSVFALAGVLR